MILDVDVDRMLVVSDLHIGSPASAGGDLLPKFIDFAAAENWTLCINGDGIDLLQGTVSTVALDGLPTFRRLREFVASGGRLLYVIGNHDLEFEHLMLDLPILVSPFLNVRSGGLRIRVEHGHLHEPFYSRWPNVYRVGGRMARPLLFASADVYRVWSTLQRTTDRRRRGRGSAYPPYEAAGMLFERGFDVVVLGHTHLPELTRLDGGLFVNGGDWMADPTFVRIDAGRVSLERWNDGDPEVIAA